MKLQEEVINVRKDKPITEEKESTKKPVMGTIITNIKYKEIS